MSDMDGFLAPTWRLRLRTYRRGHFPRCKKELRITRHRFRKTMIAGAGALLALGLGACASSPGSGGMTNGQESSFHTPQGETARHIRMDPCMTSSTGSTGAMGLLARPSQVTPWASGRRTASTRRRVKPARLIRTDAAPHPSGGAPLRTEVKQLRRPRALKCKASWMSSG